MRGFLSSLLLCLPFVAVGQTVPAIPAVSAHVAVTPEAPAPSSSVLLPGWHNPEPASWQLLVRDGSGKSGFRDWQALGFNGLGFSTQAGGGLSYALSAHWAAHAHVNQQAWLGASSIGSCLSANPAVRSASCGVDGQAQLVDSRIGASYQAARYSVGMDFSNTRPYGVSPLLPRVLPNSTIGTSVNGLPFYSLQDSSSLQARGRVALGEHTGLDMGASYGRIRLLPGNVLGIDTLGQRSLSLGLDAGSVSGQIIGRVIQPETGLATGLLGDDHRWTSVDLGVTWHLPWSGSLSFGAQNVWSSGKAPAPKVGPKSDQSRIPYVQYHQDF